MPVLAIAWQWRAPASSGSATLKEVFAAHEPFVGNNLRRLAAANSANATARLEAAKYIIRHIHRIAVVEDIAVFKEMVCRTRYAGGNTFVVTFADRLAVRYVVTPAARVDLRSRGEVPAAVSARVVVDAVDCDMPARPPLVVLLELYTASFVGRVIEERRCRKEFNHHSRAGYDGVDRAAHGLEISIEGPRVIQRRADGEVIVARLVIVLVVVQVDELLLVAACIRRGLPDSQMNDGAAWGHATGVVIGLRGADDQESRYGHRRRC